MPQHVKKNGADIFVAPAVVTLFRYLGFIAGLGNRSPLCNPHQSDGASLRSAPLWRFLGIFGCHFHADYLNQAWFEKTRSGHPIVALHRLDTSLLNDLALFGDL